MTQTRRLIDNVYRAFNARDLDAALAAVHPDVEWADGEGGFVHGRQAVREHWTDQWKKADPRLEPLKYAARADGSEVVDVRMVVRTLQGEIDSDRKIVNVFTIQDRLIQRMEIR